MFSRKDLMASTGRSTATDMTARQAPLRALYEREPGAAMIVDHARTTSGSISAADPLYSKIVFGDVNATEVPIGVHTAVGGESDLPVPGEILSGAIASCLDSAIRIIANRMGVQLKTLEVHVAASVDVRGTLRVDNQVPVGFQDIQIEVDVEAMDSVPNAQIKAIIKAAEYSCILIQTLRNPPAISLTGKVLNCEVVPAQATAA